MRIEGLFATLTLAVVLVLPQGVSRATESSSSIALTSNYIFRGQTQSNGNSAVQVNYDLEQNENDGWYTGAFASTVAKGLELDLFAGWKGAFNQQSNMGYDVGVIAYSYTERQFSPNITEFYAGVNYETAYVKIFNGSGSGLNNYNYFDMGSSFIVLEDLDLDLHFGRQLDSPSSNDVSANLSFEVKDFDLNLGVSYKDANSGSTVFFVTVGKAFK
jgi:uncharacterized protein (TIGR02001 family)